MVCILFLFIILICLSKSQCGEQRSVCNIYVLYLVLGSMDVWWAGWSMEEGIWKWQGAMGKGYWERIFSGVTLLCPPLKLRFHLNRAFFLKLNGVLVLGPILCVAVWDDLKNAYLEHISIFILKGLMCVSSGQRRTGSRLR